MRYGNLQTDSWHSTATVWSGWWLGTCPYPLIILVPTKSHFDLWKWYRMFSSCNDNVSCGWFIILCSLYHFQCSCKPAIVGPKRPINSLPAILQSDLQIHESPGGGSLGFLTGRAMYCIYETGRKHENKVFPLTPLCKASLYFYFVTNRSQPAASVWYVSVMTGM